MILLWYRKLIFSKFNELNFSKPNTNNFPLLKILNYKFNDTFFEIILIALNDGLVNKYLNNSIMYISIHKLLLRLLKKRFFVKYYKKSPKNINEIKNMVEKVNIYLNGYLNKLWNFYLNSINYI